MSDHLDDEAIIEIVPRGAEALGSPLPSTKIEDIWDVALTGTLSERSQRIYMRGMVSFAEFVLEKAGRPVPKKNQDILKQASPFLPHVRFPLITEFREKLRDDGYSPSTINVRLASIDMLFKRMMRLELIDRNPADADLVRRLKTSNISETEGLTDTEAEHMLKLLHEDNSLAGFRDRALLAVLIYNGLRRSEIIQINLDEIKFVNQTPTTQLTIKRGKRLSIEFVPPVWMTIEKWLHAAGITQGPIFRRLEKSTGGNQKTTEDQLTDSGVYVIIRSRVRQAGIEKNIHPHSFRHTYATLALLAGVPIQEVQISMGHSSTDTTFRYYRAIEQVGKSPGRAIKLNWPAGPKDSKETDR